MVPASAATMLKVAGHEAIWDDAIAEQKPYDSWLKEVAHESPELIAIEAKAPVIKRYWKTISDIKAVSPQTKTVLCGDHVTAYPEESFKSSDVDYVITGGDFDFTLLSLANHLDGKDDLAPGIWYMVDRKVKATVKYRQRHNHSQAACLDT